MNPSYEFVLLLRSRVYPLLLVLFELRVVRRSTVPSEVVKRVDAVLPLPFISSPTAHLFNYDSIAWSHSNSECSLVLVHSRPLCASLSVLPPPPAVLK